MQKRINTENQVSSNDIVNELISSHVSKLQSSTVKELNLSLKKLNHLCDRFDPFDFLNHSPEVENILNEFELSQFESNPFDFTKVVLKLIDTIETIKNSNTKRVH